MIYILIIALHYGNAPAFHSSEFNTKEACQSASQEFSKQYGRGIDAVFCVAKGEKK